ncbi:uncharacterized protein MELLADRAFT_124274 [Melampsora larici-populina 98AG31]|uniref:Secreted protein n=1 Tax=Melampsora larici-populina (strain 98AG31 / pathotype 3-4-7) TaxID=747676 RepID=F4S2D2_MELLP|nr:uncharacterized protein MELLADRAFT_124274 [Melampsora larici-populina 98AG31]EGG01153.1 secreted protein [Melampsora larici-populina 98AG31]
MVNGNLRRIILLSLMSGIAVKPTICDLLSDTERLELIGFSDTRRLRTSLEDDDKDPASEKIDCAQVTCDSVDSEVCENQGCWKGCLAHLGHCSAAGM